ncbi:MAG: ribonuclease III [Azorhizobium sp. 32-67-21]|nr:MAG: ribonuclease III [Azorhizobium sp. 32-67-21]
MDALTQATLQSLTLATPPGAPSDGQCWYVPTGATGVWAGRSGTIAAYEAGAWDFFTPPVGLRAYVQDERRVRVFDGGAFVSPLASSLHRAAVEAVVLEEDVTLSGASRDTTILIPDRALVLGVSTRTLQAVTGAASYDCGLPAERTKFGGTLGIAVGATNVGVIGPTAFYAATAIRISANGGSFTGGKVRVALHMLTLPAPAA